MVKSRKGLRGVERGKGKCYQRKEPLFEGTPKAAPPSEPSMTRGRSTSRKRSVRGRRQTVRILRQPCRYFLKGTFTRSLCEYWHLPECQFYTIESRCKAGDKCLFPHYKVEEQPTKKPKKSFQNGKSDDKGAAALVKTVPQLGWVSQDSELLELPNSVKYRRNPRRKVLGSVRRERFTQSTLRQASI